MTSQHTSQHFEAQLEELKARLLAMAGRCESAIQDAIQAIVERDAAAARRIIEADRQINADEMAVDDLAEKILALRQPMGRDLRFTIAALKAVTDLERIGDEAVNLAERAEQLAAAPQVPPPAQLVPTMAERTAAMLRRALEAFLREDAEGARAVFAMDDEVDELYGTILRASVRFMANHPDQVEAGMAVASCAKYLERIADHATNVAEMVVYLARGVDVRHKGDVEGDQGPQGE